MGKKGGISIFVFIFIFVILAMIYSLTMKDNIEVKEGLTGRKTGGIKTRGIIMIVVFGAILVTIIGTIGRSNYWYYWLFH